MTRVERYAEAMAERLGISPAWSSLAKAALAAMAVADAEQEALRAEVERLTPWSSPSWPMGVVKSDDGLAYAFDDGWRAAVEMFKKFGPPSAWKRADYPANPYTYPWESAERAQQ